VHTFSATLRTAGSQSLTATDTVTGSISGTQSGVAVSPAAAVAFTVSGFPSPVAAGAAGSFTVIARDAYGNTATGYTGTVHFTSSDGQAALPADYTFTSSDTGRHSFSATLRTAGSQSITATDTVSSTITGSQAGITVVQPPSITSASANPNPVTGKTTQLTAGATDPNGGSLIYTWSLVSGPAGVTFGSNNGTTSGNNVTATFSTAGSYTFQVTVTDSFGMSSTRNVTVTVQQTLTSVTIAPATASIRLGRTVQFTATALDQFGNALAVQPSFAWAVVSGPGTISSDGLYTGTSDGSAVIQATVTTATGTTISGSATVTVKKH
jgi:hypothetical protein